MLGQLSLHFVISCGAVIRASRFGLALTRPELICCPSSHRAPRGAISKRHPESPIYRWSSTTDFGPAASYISRGPNETDRLSTRIGPQAQREQVGETEGSLDE